MVGIAAGNLLGLPYEGRRWDAERIHRRFGARGVREIAADSGWPDDDDLAQAIALAEACEGVEQLDLEDFLRRLWDWAEINGLGMGSHTRHALTLFGGASPRRQLRHYVRDGVPPDGEPPREPCGMPAADAARAAWEDGWEKHGSYSAANGAVMRCAPVAIRWFGDDAALARNSIVSAAATHWDPRCTWSAALVNATAALCLRGEAVDAEQLLLRAGIAEPAIRDLRDELAPCATGAHPPAEVSEAAASALSDGTEVGDLDLGGPASGYVIKTLKAALWAAVHPRSFEDGLSAIVSAGGDADTNGAAAGAVLGARFGLSGIPAHWRERVAEIRSYADPSLPEWPERRPMEEYADRLLAL